jgi:hypothetical protein
MSLAHATSWQKARASNQTDCVELRRNGDCVEMRDSKNPEGAILRYSRLDLATLLAAARNGEFDDLSGGKAR